MIYKILDRLFSPLYLMSLMLKKDLSLWVFGEYCGNTYKCNPKHLFEYVNQHHPEVRAVWLARKFSVIQKIRAAGGRACHVYSPLGLFYAMRAGAVFCNIDLACDFVGAIISKHTLYINLWHGTPLKMVGADVDRGGVQSKPWANQIKRILEFIGLRHVHAVNLFASASDEVSKKLQSAFHLSREQVQVTGYPRNDALFNQGIPAVETLKNIIYMPTFRGNVGAEVDFFYAYKFDFDKAERFLAANNARLWIRLHQFNMPRSELVEKIEASEYIFMHQHEDIYEELNSFDILITDLSSIYFDYLLLNRPIVFSAFDIEQYILNDRALYYPYDEITPGPKARDWDEVLAEVGKFLDTPTAYAQERRQVCSQFNKYIDGGSCQRMVSSVKRQLSVEQTK